MFSFRGEGICDSSNEVLAQERANFCEKDLKAKKIAYRVHMNPRSKLCAIWRERLPNDPEAIISNEVPDVWEEPEKKNRASQNSDSPR